MEFKKIRAGQYFPPTLPSGRFYAVAVGGRMVQEILMITDAGLECGGVNFLWSEISGFSIRGEEACVMSQKYPSGGLRFRVGTCHFVGRDLLPEKYLAGYPVEYCLMNRITFEQQRLQVSAGRYVVVN